MTDTAIDSAEAREIVREAVTMALYVSLSLLAVVLATPDVVRETRLEVTAIAITTVFGLLLAHMLAFAVSTQLVSEGRFDRQSGRILGAQFLGGLAVAVLVAVPTLLFDPHTSLVLAEALLGGLVALVALVAARTAGTSWPRSIVYMLIILAAANAVLLIKTLVGH